MTSVAEFKTYAVLVFDMSRTGEPDGERLVEGFKTLEAARAYAEARVRSSVEELREENQAPAELRSLWHLYGEDCVVIGGGYSGRDNLDAYIFSPASPEEARWSGLGPELEQGPDRKPDQGSLPSRSRV